MNVNKISVALCTYNGEKYIKEQLESIISQSRCPDEIIIYDDKSTDSTIEIIESFKRNAPIPVSLFINEQNLKSTKNFEKAIESCSGDIIFLADQDDVWVSNKVEIMETVFIKNPKAGLVFTNAEVVDRDLNDLGYSLWESIAFSNKERELVKNKPLQLFIKKCVVTGATMAFRSELRAFCLPISSDWVHDAWLSFMIASLKEIEMVAIDEKLIKYRQHGGNQIGAIKLGTIEKYRKNKNRVVHLGGSIGYEELMQSLENNRDFVKDEVFGMLEEKHQHLLKREKLPNNLVIRIFPVFLELIRMRYSKYSLGIKSAIKDVLP